MREEHAMRDPIPTSRPASRGSQPGRHHVAFVISQYQEHLGRLPDFESLKHYHGQLESGAMTREAVTDAILSSPEFLALYGLPPAEEMEAMPVFGYTLRYQHTVTTLAQDFDLEPRLLAALNGWPSIDHRIPGGTVVKVQDTAETRAMARRYGGAVIEIAGAPAA